MQFFILLVGVMVFVFYQFNASPLNFNPKANEAIINSEYAAEYKVLESQHIQIENEKRTLLLDGVQDNERARIKELNAKDKALKVQAKEIIEKADSSVQTNDKDYVFIHFILTKLPRGIIGLLLAVILAAAMSSTASELNALASTTTIDIYKRNVSQGRSEAHYVKASKWLTFTWGLLAILIACVADLFDNLIQLVNIIGSVFYGNVLGIFLLAFFIKHVRGTAVFVAAIITQLIIFIIYFMDILPYLWLNLIGCVIVMILAIFIQPFIKKPNIA